MKNVRTIVFMGLFIALNIVFTRILSIQTPIVRIGFSFLPIAISAIMFGPMIGGVTAAIADIIGVMLFPPQGGFFPGFTLSAFLGGVIYGLFLYKRPVTIIRTGISVLMIKLFVDLGLNTVWLSILWNKGVLAILPSRIISNAAMLPIQIVVIFLVWRAIGDVVNRQAASRV